MFALHPRGWVACMRYANISPRLIISSSHCSNLPEVRKTATSKQTRRFYVQHGTEEEENKHFHAGPKGPRGLVVPCVYDAASNMFALWGGLFDTRSFSDIDRQFTFGPAKKSCQHENESLAKQGNLGRLKALEATNLV